MLKRQHLEKRCFFRHMQKLGKNLPYTDMCDMIDSTKGKEKEFEKILLNLLQAEKFRLTFLCLAPHLSEPRVG